MKVCEVCPHRQKILGTALDKKASPIQYYKHCTEKQREPVEKRLTAMPTADYEEDWTKEKKAHGLIQQNIHHP